MPEAKYEALRDQNAEKVDAEINWVQNSHSRNKRQLSLTILVSFLLVISAVLNVIAYLPSKELQRVTIKTYTVSPEADVPVQNLHAWRSIYDPVWDEPRYSYTAGLIAVDDDYVKKHSLPEAQRWPWDKSKSIYMLQGWHSMHCIMVLRDALISVDKNTTMTHSFQHLTHCLHTLRDDVACYADDTPMYTGAFNEEAGKTIVTPGAGQFRMCRNWDAVRQFGLERSACYDAFKGGIYGPEVDKYKFCPDGSKPWL